MLSVSTSAYQIEIENHVLDVTQVILDMRDFNVIIGMDWLSINHASINCSCKIVVFNPHAEASFKYKRAETAVLHKVTLAI